MTEPVDPLQEYRRRESSDESSWLGNSPLAGTWVELTAGRNRPISRGRNASGAVIGHDQVDRNA
jgi:hypothetical protein